MYGGLTNLMFECDGSFGGGPCFTKFFWRKLYDRLYLDNSDRDTYKVTFRTEMGLLKDVYHHRIIG